MSGYELLANQVVNLLSSFIINGGESFAEKYGEKTAQSLTDNTTKLFSNIIKKFESDEDDRNDLEKFQRKPERYSEQIKQLLEDKMKNDKAFASDISTVIKKIQGLNVNINIEKSQTKNITGIESNKDEGNFSATIKGSTATEDIIGGKITFETSEITGKMTVKKAGRKGGEAVVEKYGPEYMAEIGRKGEEYYHARRDVCYNESKKGQKLDNIERGSEKRLALDDEGVRERETLTRFPYVAFPKTIYVEEIAPLEIIIKIKGFKPLYISTEAVSKDKKISVHIIIDNGTFEIIDPITLETSLIFYGTIYVPIEEKDSDPIIFLLRAKKEGNQNIYIRFYQNGSYLGKYIINVYVSSELNKTISQIKR